MFSHSIFLGLNTATFIFLKNFISTTMRFTVLFFGFLMTAGLFGCSSSGSGDAPAPVPESVWTINNESFRVPASQTIISTPHFGTTIAVASLPTSPSVNVGSRVDIIFNERPTISRSYTLVASSTLTNTQCRLSVSRTTFNPADIVAYDLVTSNASVQVTVNNDKIQVVIPQITLRTFTFGNVTPTNVTFSATILN